MAYLEIINVSKSFGGKKILENINLKLEKSSFTSLLGLSGCGKTTLLRIIAGLETVDTGQIILDGKDITKTTIQKRNIGIVFQNFALFPHLTVAENVAYGLKIKKINASDIKLKVEDVLRKVNLAEKAKQNVASLSGGEQQRVALARAIATEPSLILLDEPLSNLDQSLRIEARDELKRLQNEIGITTVYVTHDQSEALALSDTIALMNQGNIVQAGTPDTIYFSPTTIFSAEFVGHYNILEQKQALELFQYKLPPNAKLALLPETIQIMPTNGINAFTITNKVFAGAFTEYVLESKGYSIRIVQPTQHSKAFQINDLVSITVAKEDFILISS